MRNMHCRTRMPKRYTKRRHGLAIVAPNSGDTMGFCLACAIEGKRSKSFEEEYADLAAEEWSEDTLSEDWS